MEGTGFPNLSKNDFKASFELFLNLPKPQFGLEFRLDTPLEDAFGVTGLRFQRFKVRAAFLEPPVPSEIGFDADVRFKTQFSGTCVTTSLPKSLQDTKLNTPTESIWNMIKLTS